MTNSTGLGLPTKSGMQNLQESDGLGPFCKISNTAIHILSSHKWDEKDDSAEDSHPKNGAGKIVENQILIDELTARGRCPIH